jgi:hypothetical protein
MGAKLTPRIAKIAPNFLNWPILKYEIAPDFEKTPAPTKAEITP